MEIYSIVNYIMEKKSIYRTDPERQTYTLEAIRGERCLILFLIL